MWDFLKYCNMHMLKTPKQGKNILIRYFNEQRILTFYSYNSKKEKENKEKEQWTSTKMNMQLRHQNSVLTAAAEISVEIPNGTSEDSC